MRALLVFSDPGLEVVKAAVTAGVPVIPIPGANAALSALVASGMDTDRFLYAGFLAAKPGTRRTELETLAAKADGLTLVLDEVPHRTWKPWPMWNQCGESKRGWW